MEDREKESWGTVAMWVVIIIILVVALLTNL